MKLHCDRCGVAYGTGGEFSHRCATYSTSGGTGITSVPQQMLCTISPQQDPVVDKSFPKFKPEIRVIKDDVYIMIDEKNAVQFATLKLALKEKSKAIEDFIKELSDWCHQILPENIGTDSWSGDKLSAMDLLKYAVELKDKI